MTKEFSTVGVFGKRDSLDYEPLRIIAELLIKSGRQVLLEKKPAEALSLGEGFTRDEIGKKSDLIIIYGGDGTFLGVFPAAWRTTMYPSSVLTPVVSVL